MELSQYKQFLSTLTKDDLIERDRYLRELNTGKLLGPMTGYPSINKPALRYYAMDKYRDIQRAETVTEALFRQNRDNTDYIALEFFYTKITFAQFFNEVEKLVKALRHFGISKNDTVAICLAGIPEAMYAVYALGYLGAVGIFFPPYLDKDTMKNDINKGKCRLLFVMDMFYEKAKPLFDDVIPQTDIEQIVIIPTLNSSVLGKIKKPQHPKSDNILLYNNFIKLGSQDELPPMVEYEEQMPLAVVYSSGSTGILKGVLLSHDTFNNSASSYLSFGFDLRKGQKVYQAIPVWSSTGLIADGSTALYYGCTLHQNPKFDPLVYSLNLGLFRDNWGVATTELFNGLVTLKEQPKFKLMKKLGIVDYSHLENVYIGGTFSTPKDRQRLNGILGSLGCKAKVRASYGTCENGSIVTAELNGVEHPDYSVGIPIPGVTVIAIDENYHELPYYQRGELIVKTDCGMIGYYNRPDLDGIFIPPETGLVGYKHTGDIGYVMPSGDVIYEGRANDTSIVDGKTIYNFDVKRILLADKDVFDCEVFIHTEQNRLCANIVFIENAYINNKKKLHSLQQAVFDCFHDICYVPELFKIRESFPMASSTKRDFKKLKSETDGYIVLSKSWLVE